MRTLPVLEVESAEDPFDVTQPTGCTEIAQERVPSRYCEGASVALGRNSIDPGYPEMVLRNPETAV